MLHDKNFIVFTGSRWTWDLDQIRSCGMMGSGVDLVLEKFDLLPLECQEVGGGGEEGGSGRKETRGK
jgi:hypothetical protein